MDISTSYLGSVLDPESLKEAIAIFKHASRAVGFQFDAIAVRGNSGTLFGGALSVATSRPLILVRKQAELSHSNMGVEGAVKAQRYLFVDDIMFSGHTFRSTVKSISDLGHGGKCVGVFLYNAGHYWFRDDNGVDHSNSGLRFNLPTIEKILKDY